MEPEIRLYTETDAQTLSLVVIDNDDDKLHMLWQMAKEKFLNVKRSKTGSQATYNAYSHDLVLYEKWLIESGINYWEITPGIVIEWYNWMNREGKVIERDADKNPTKWGPLSEATVNRRIASVSGFYDYVIRKEIYQLRDGRYLSLWDACHPQQHGLANPFTVIERHHFSQYGRATYPEYAEAQAMLNQINIECVTGARDYALFHTILTTCRRFSEVINMRWGDISTRRDGHYQWNYVYKGGKPRKAQMPRECYANICHYLRMDGRRPEDMKADDFIFIAIRPEVAERLPHIDQARGEQPISNSQANRALKKYARKAKVDLAKAHIHGLRHAGARLRKQRMQESGKGVDWEAIRDLLGHGNLSTTEIYARAVLDDPQDDGGADAAEQWRQQKKRRRRKEKPVPPEQESF